MMRLLDDLGRRALALVDIHPTRIRKGTVSGASLPHDLSEVVTAARPLCLDVGANRGQTIRLLQSALRAPRIHAFEPSPDAFHHLQQAGFGADVALHNVALGETAGQRDLIHYDNSELNSLLEMAADPANPFRQMSARARTTTAVWSVDQFLAGHPIAHVHLLKVDTQGLDLEVLRGAIGAFQRAGIDAVMVEINFVPMYAGQGSATDIMAFLDAHDMAPVGFYERAYRDGALAWCTALFRRRLAGKPVHSPSH